MITVSLADDQALVRAGFRMILEVEDGIEVVGEAADGTTAIRLARERQPDVLLMDIRMPVLDGIEATREIIRLGCPTRILILTTFDHDQYLYEAMRAGAAGFIVKDTSRDQLIHAIQVIADGDALLAPNLVRRLIEDFCHRPAPGPDVPAALATLTERELDVLRHVARGLSNTEIAATLFISEATVKTHLAHTMTKLGLRDRVQAVVLAYETGLRHVMWVDLRCGETDAHQGMGGDGCGGAGEQAPEGMSAVAGQFHPVGDLGEGGLDPVAPLGDDRQQDGGHAGTLILGGRDQDRSAAGRLGGRECPAGETLVAQQVTRWRPGAEQVFG